MASSPSPRRFAAAAAALVFCLAVGCASIRTGHGASQVTPLSEPSPTVPPLSPVSSSLLRLPSPSLSSTRSSSPVVTTPPSPPPTSLSVAAPTRTATFNGSGLALPEGGRQILGHYRIVAFYGGPDGPALGVLGSQPPDEIAAAIEKRAAAFTGYGLPVQPAMELITTVAQGGPGPDGLYSRPIPHAQVEAYLAAAHRHHMLLILDFQPGRGEFLPQVEQFEDVLTDPSVEVALDPEWKMGLDQVPGTVIGSASAASIDVVRDYLAKLVARDRLPDKLLLVHEFTRTMLPDRWRITPRTGVEVALHADGFGTQQAKLATWNALAFPGRPFGTGFKLFLTQDTDMMTPAQVMKLRPRPDIVTYQ
jgi:hypothetical protein